MKKMVILMIIIVFIFISYISRQMFPEFPVGSEPAIAPILLEATVIRVPDGDTIAVRLKCGKRESVRLVGIDAPEVWRRTKTGWIKEPEQGGLEARDKVKRKILDQVVYLDINDPRPRDRFNRLLAVVYINKSDADKGLYYSFNAKLLRAGYVEILH